MNFWTSTGPDIGMGDVGRCPPSELVVAVESVCVALAGAVLLGVRMVTGSVALGVEVEEVVEVVVVVDFVSETEARVMLSK